ncbi:serine protease [Streptomyces carminius]|uniref:Serine protease n=2 Tax=Streptomyces carminius TaxID=2665496 RepID=A0A2M8LU88_9ACTN|nr:serine protease [Streptomyces carminius]
MAAGAGALLTPEHLVTCAHVINGALGREPFDPRRPGTATVTVAVHGRAGSRKYTARIAHWIPACRSDNSDTPPHQDDLEWYGDLAVLHLTGQIGGDPLLPPQWRPMHEGRTVRAWHGTALPGSFADALVKSCDGRIGYLDGDSTGMAVGHAYSGGPLWSAVDNAVIGLVAARMAPQADPVTGSPAVHDPQHVIRRSWAIPWQRVQEELRTVGAEYLFAGTPSLDRGREDPAYPLLRNLLERHLSRGELREATAEVMDRCGLVSIPSSVGWDDDQLALLLLTEPRALAAFTDSLQWRLGSVLPEFLSVGRLSTVPLLLSPGEHRALHTLLSSLPDGAVDRFPEAVRAALPLAAAMPHGSDLDVLLRWLEQLPGDGRADSSEQRMPALLRVIEYFATLCSASPRAKLRLWNDGVANRLEISRPALRERRADAEEWERHTRSMVSAPRVLVHVETVEGNHRLRIWCDRGDGLRQMYHSGESVCTARQAAREVLGVVEPLARLAPEGQRPLVEVLVDRTGLDVPVDEWESPGPDGLVPGVLGAEYPLVVHCPELLRRYERFLTDWRRRWRRLDTGTVLHISDSTASPRTVYGALMERLDTVQVVVDLPARIRAEVVQVCIAVGVPVVLWDRSPQGNSHALRHTARHATRALPEEVRAYRAKTVHRPQDHPGRPVLAWADADRPVPALHLSEPMEAP